MKASWLCYFEVADGAKSAAKVKGLGGKVLFDPMKVPGASTFAVVRDPQGAAFGLMS